LAAREAELKAELKRLEGEKKAADQAAKTAPPDKAAEAKAAADAAKKAVEKAKKDLDHHERSPLPFPTAYAVAEAPTKGNAKVQLKGNPEKPGPEVPRRFLAVLGGQTLASDDTGSGRRALADWLVAESNPLTPRVLVNRLWHHHFGRGIVPTTSDFGKQGKPPTHPELLDWLARRFVENGWSIKAMHRLMLHSRAYRMSSADHPANAEKDPGNEWLWRWNRRRLDAEVIRDSMLAVAGTLDREPGGEHPFPHPTTWGFTQHHPFKAVYETNKRSVYLMTQRFAKHPFLGIFDGADPNFSTPFRVTSTTTLQALWFLNDPFVHAQAKAFAERLAKEAGGDPAARVDLAYRLALGRPPRSSEREAALAYVSGRPWDSFTRALLRLAEFVYVD
ncbi:MAG TPA: DUF1553 domain-containing protein, partial [Planctomycetota bacterium]|nr:DUF1553 domain-containing protein [Planctomycetota bacterium]